MAKKKETKKTEKKTPVKKSTQMKTAPKKTATKKTTKKTKTAVAPVEETKEELTLLGTPTGVKTQCCSDCHCEEETKTEGSKKIKVISWIVLAAIVLFLVLMCAVPCGNSSAEKGVAPVSNSMPVDTTKTDTVVTALL